MFLINYLIRYRALYKLNSKNEVVTCPYFILAVYFVQRPDDRLTFQSLAVS